MTRHGGPPLLRCFIVSQSQVLYDAANILGWLQRDDQVADYRSIRPVGVSQRCSQTYECNSG